LYEGSACISKPFYNSMNLNCAIVEDDNFSRVVIEALVEKTPFLKLKGSFSSGQEASLWLNQNSLDLLFLDIEMPDMSGFDLLKALPLKPDVIVVSASPDYAVDAFNLAITDYLVKPVKDYSRFLAAVNKVLAKKAAVPDKPEDDSVFIKVDSLLLKIELNDILWVEAFGDYIKFQTNEKVYTVYSTLKNIEEKLDTKKFVRVHRSYIVNISKIQNIDPNNLIINKKIIPVSASYKELLLNKIKIL
jgi:DNA-binding LytR/AlgR family response regulator